MEDFLVPCLGPIDFDFTREEILSSVFEMADGKCSDRFGLTTELFRELLRDEDAPHVMQSLLTYMNSLLAIQEQAHFPAVTFKLIFLPKGNGPLLHPLKGIRPISILDKLDALVYRVVYDRLRVLAPNSSFLHGTCVGLPGLEVNRAGLLLKSTLRASLERNLPLHLCRFDVVKAFDSLPLEFICHVVYEAFKDKSFRFLRFVIHLIGARRRGIFRDETIPFNQGVSQGSSLSSFIFVLVFDFLVRQVAPENDLEEWLSRLADPFSMAA